jgi:hypothetical protein
MALGCRSWLRQTRNCPAIATAARFPLSGIDMAAFRVVVIQYRRLICRPSASVSKTREADIPTTRFPFYLELERMTPLQSFLMGCFESSTLVKHRYTGGEVEHRGFAIIRYLRLETLVRRDRSCGWRRFDSLGAHLQRIGRPGPKMELTCSTPGTVVR